MLTVGAEPPDPRRAAESWPVVERGGDAATLHAVDLGWERGLWVMRPTRPAVVLGSTQPDETIDSDALARLGFDRVRRRSGGGAVHLTEDAMWIDVTIPRGDAMWRDDVSSSALWLGHAWCAVLAAAGMSDVGVHSGPMVHHPLERVVCFAGLAPGEVADGAGAKIVGISQRRSRDGARFQCVAYRRWQPEVWAAVVGPAAADLPVRPLASGSSPTWLESPTAPVELAIRLASVLARH